MAIQNSINITATGLITADGAGVYSGSTVTQYGVVIASTSNAVTSVAPSATTGLALVSAGASANPAFGVVSVDGGGTGVSTLRNHGLLIGTDTSAVRALFVAGDGKILMGRDGLDPAWGSLTAGDGIARTEGVGSLTVSTVGGGFGWSVVTDAAVALAINKGYIGNRGTSITYTLPTVAAVGSAISITNIGAGLPIIAQNVGESINVVGSTTTVTTGTLTATEQFDSITIVCVVNNTTWNVVNMTGNWSIV